MLDHLSRNRAEYLFFSGMISLSAACGSMINAQNPPLLPAEQITARKMIVGGRLKTAATYPQGRSTDPGHASLEDLLNSSIETAAEKLNLRGEHTISPEDLVYLSRLLYFESGNNGRNLEELRNGLDGVMHTILNRWKFDNGDYGITYMGKKIKTGYRRFGDGSLMSIVAGRGAKEFTAIGKKKPFFRRETFRDKGGRFSLIYGQQEYNLPIKKALAECYRSVLRALSGNSADPTDGSLFYKNPLIATSRYPCHGAHAGAVAEESRPSRGIKMRAGRNYTITRSIVIGLHHFYNVRMTESLTIWDNNDLTTRRYVDGKMAKLRVRSY